jgi:hypothetical protein
MVLMPTPGHIEQLVPILDIYALVNFNNDTFVWQFESAPINLVDHFSVDGTIE